MQRFLATAAVFGLSTLTLTGCLFAGGPSHGHGLRFGRHGGGWKMGTWLVLAFQVMAVVEILRRDDLSRQHQALWALAVLLVPVIGLIAYAVAGRNGCGTSCCGRKA